MYAVNVVGYTAPNNALGSLTNYRSASIFRTPPGVRLDKSAPPNC